MASQRDVGRPLKFQSVEELQQKIDAYFAECDPHWISETILDYQRSDKGKILYEAPLVEKTIPRRTEQIPYTITGLAMALGTTRETLLDYESGKYDDPTREASLNADFSDTIKAAKLKCQNFAELRLFGGQIVAGIIFNLKNNYGRGEFAWKDRQEITGADGAPVNLGPEAATALDNILGEMKNGKVSGSGSPAVGLPESAESTDVQPDIHESHPEEPAATA